jgi:predicted transcriptional regulator
LPSADSAASTDDSGVVLNACAIRAVKRAEARTPRAPILVSVAPRNHMWCMSPPSISIRFPPSLREQLQERATAERRSLSNLITTLLTGALDARREQVPTEDDWMRMFAETFKDVDGDA